MLSLTSRQTMILKALALAGSLIVAAQLAPAKAATLDRPAPLNAVIDTLPVN